MTFEQDLASGWCEHAGNDTEQRGLAGTVRAEHPKRFAIGQFEVEVFGNHHRAEVFADSFQRQDRVHTSPDHACGRSK
jgi:hypothetical protein